MPQLVLFLNCTIFLINQSNSVFKGTRFFFGLFWVVLVSEIPLDGQREMKSIEEVTKHIMK